MVPVKHCGLPRLVNSDGCILEQSPLESCPSGVRPVLGIHCRGGCLHKDSATQVGGSGESSSPCQVSEKHLAVVQEMQLVAYHCLVFLDEMVTHNHLIQVYLQQISFVSAWCTSSMFLS